MRDRPYTPAGLLADPVQTHGFIDWRMGDPQILRHFKELHPQEGKTVAEKQFTLELRVDFSDPEKYEVVKVHLAKLARQLTAKCKLLMDNGIKPRCALHSDNFFMAPEAIDSMEGVISRDDAAADVEEEQVSAEMLEAMKGLGGND